MQVRHVVPQGAQPVASSSRFGMLDASSDEEEDFLHLQDDKLSVVSAGGVDSAHTVPSEPELSMYLAYYWY
jgi:hypothetical protein